MVGARLKRVLLWALYPILGLEAGVLAGRLFAWLTPYGLPEPLYSLSPVFFALVGAVAGWGFAQMGRRLSNREIAVLAATWTGLFVVAAVADMSLDWPANAFEWVTQLGDIAAPTVGLPIGVALARTQRSGGSSDSN